MANIKENIKQSIWQTMQQIIPKAISEAQFDKTVQGRVINVLADNKYEVEIDGVVFTAPSLIGYNYKKGDPVWIKYPRNNKNLMFIISTTTVSSNEPVEYVNWENILNKPKAIDSTYIHNQLVASNTWTINHNLNKFPAVSIVDSAGSVVFGDIQFIDLNNIILKFSVQFAGKAYLN